MSDRSRSRRRRKVQPEDTYLLRNVSDPQISPDGERIAYTVAARNRDKDRFDAEVWVSGIDGSGARRFTNGTRSHSPRWSPDGRSLAFVSNRGDRSQLYVAPLDGGDPQRLTRARHGVGQPAWSPDGRHIAYLAAVGEETPHDDKPPAERAAPRVIRDLYFRFDGAGIHDERRRHVFSIEVETGESRQLTDGDWHDARPAWSPDGVQIAFTSDRSEERRDRLARPDVWVVPARGGRARRLTRGRGSASGPAFSPDGKWVAFVGHEHPDNETARNLHLMVVPARGAGRAPRSLSAPLDRSVIGGAFAPPVTTFAWLPDSEGLVFLAEDRGSTVLSRAELSGGACKRVLEGDRTIDSLALAPGGERLAFSSSWSSAFPEVWTASLSGAASPRPVSGLNAELRARVELSPTERMTYRSFDGLEIEAFVLHPPGRRRKLRPLVLHIHGGPHGAHPSAYSPIFFQSLAAAGYVVLLPNPRGSSSYGEDFSRACVGDWGGGDYRDLMAGVDLLVERGIADPDQLYVGGYSYGGYMSSWIVGQTGRFRAACIGAPLTNLASAFATGDIPHVLAEEIGGTPLAAPEAYVRRSPVTYLENARTPVQLLHWEGDLRCPIGQSEEVFSALKLRGVEVEMVRYPGGSHVGRTPAQDVDSIRRTLEWYAAHAVRGPAARPPALRGGRRARGRPRKAR